MLSDFKHRDYGISTAQVVRDTTTTRRVRLSQAPHQHPVTEEAEIAITPMMTPSEIPLTISYPTSIVLKTNGMQLLAGVTNIGAEITLGAHYSVDLPITYSPYTISRNYKMRILAIQPEFRYWLDNPLVGHFFGAHLHLCGFNVATNKQDRSQDSRLMWGFGLSYGYSMPLSERLGLEFNLGAGYANIGYDTYFNIANGAKYKTDQVKNYIGITRIAASIVYKLK